MYIIYVKFYFNLKEFFIFRYFLSTNTFYDELLAINIAGQTYLWEVLHHLATHRSLYSQMLDILVKALQIFGKNDIHLKSCNVFVRGHTHTHAHTHTHTHTHTHARTHTHTHTHTHTRTHKIYEI